MNPLEKSSPNGSHGHYLYDPHLVDKFLKGLFVII